LPRLLAGVVGHLALDLHAAGAGHAGDLGLPAGVVVARGYTATSYARGACDAGVKTLPGRPGVAAPLVGRYVPYGADALVNVYSNAQGQAVRVTLSQCDNAFSERFPRPTHALPTPQPSTPAPAIPMRATAQPFLEVSESRGT
jgi:hypothetical protein